MLKAARSLLPSKINTNGDGSKILSASARTRRCVVIHFDLRYHQDVVLGWWSGRPFWIAVAARSITLAHDFVASRKRRKAGTQYQESGFLPPVVP